MGWAGPACWQDDLRPQDRAQHPLLTPDSRATPAVISKKRRKEAIGDACWSAGKVWNKRYVEHRFCWAAADSTPVLSTCIHSSSLDFVYSLPLFVLVLLP